MSAFDRLNPALQHHIVNSLGWRSLRPVQSLTIEAVLEGANTVVLAPTAGGKTEAAFFPLMSQMLEEPRRGLSILYVSPIKALLNNVEYRLRRYFSLVGHRVGVWHGDISASVKQRMADDFPDCVLTTPESLEVMLITKRVDHHQAFRNLRAIVVDEVHSFASDDRGWHLLSLIQRISRLAGTDVQRIGLSATVGNPEEIVDWLSAGSERPRTVVKPEEGSGAARPEVMLDYVGSLGNAAKVVHAMHRGEKRLVFCDSRARVEDLGAELRGLGTKVFVTHSSLGLDERRQAETAFADGQNCVIVATSALELGIDVGDLDRVIQVDAPRTVSSFLQRMGRTGRRPETQSNCLFLATTEDALLQGAALIELWQKGGIEPVRGPTRPMHILAQQAMALALQEGGIGRSEWFAWIRAVPAFRDLPKEDVESLVDWLLKAEILWSEEGILWLGKEGVDKYGVRNFMELFTVFTSPPLFTILHGKRELGKVDQSTFITRDEGPAVLLLGGKSWEVKHIDWSKRQAYVEQAESKGRSRWVGRDQPLSYELCQAIQKLLASDEEPENWSRRGREQMAGVREEFSWVREGQTFVVRDDSDETYWWTFAGERANASLAHQLAGMEATGIAFNNLAVRLRPGTDVAGLKEDLERLKRVPPAEMLPKIGEDALRGLKFSECLPRALALSVVQDRLMDEAAVREVLKRPVVFVSER